VSATQILHVRRNTRFYQRGKEGIAIKNTFNNAFREFVAKFTRENNDSFADLVRHTDSKTHELAVIRRSYRHHAHGRYRIWGEQGGLLQYTQENSGGVEQQHPQRNQYKKGECCVKDVAQNACRECIGESKVVLRELSHVHQRQK